MRLFCNGAMSASGDMAGHSVGSVLEVSKMELRCHHRGATLAVEAAVYLRRRDDDTQLATVVSVCKATASRTSGKVVFLVLSKGKCSVSSYAMSVDKQGILFCRLPYIQNTPDGCIERSIRKTSTSYE